MSQQELTNEGKINEFMNGLIKYIQDKEKKHEKDLRELDKQAGIELREQEEALRATILAENTEIATSLEEAYNSIARCKNRIGNEQYSAHIEKNRLALQKHTKTKNMYEKKIEKMILEKQAQLAL